MTEMRRSMPQSGSATLAKPHIVRIDPTEFKSRGKEQFTITGSGFKTDCRVVFQLKSNPEDKVVIEPDSVTETEIKGITKPMTAGTTLVWVRNPDGSESNKKEVNVVS